MSLEQQQVTDSEHTHTPEAYFTRTASHARHITYDTDTKHGTRFADLSSTCSQPLNFVVAIMFADKMLCCSW